MSNPYSCLPKDRATLTPCPPNRERSTEESAHHYRLLLSDEPDDLIVLQKPANQLFRVTDADARNQSTAALDRWAGIVALQRRLFAAGAAESRHDLGVALAKYVHALHGGISPELAAELHDEAVAVLANPPGGEVRELHKASRSGRYVRSLSCTCRGRSKTTALGQARNRRSDVRNSA